MMSVRLTGKTIQDKMKIVMTLILVFHELNWSLSFIWISECKNDL